MKRNGKKARKIRKLIITCTLSAVVLIVSTYTWFIGMQTVNVSPFEIEVATTEGLFLSMDGENWAYTLDVTKTDAYTGHTNTWATEGLKPVSTVGDLDSKVSRLKLFEKASLTTSPGGYRLLASQVDNYSEVKDGEGKVTGISQGEGYIAFDLFIKNLSGAEYYPTNNILNEEAIYLTTDSLVKIKSNGSDDQEKTGIENSIRVGFAQIGRVEATEADASVITSMDCDGDEDAKVTGICRNAQIWEPNETKHVDNAVNWYNKSCITRKAEGTTITSSGSYNVTEYENGAVKTPAVYCKETGNFVNTKEVPTYAISRAIDIADNVDVYDGAAFNKYEGNTVKYDVYSKAEKEVKDTYKLVEYPYFTDEMKNTAGTARPEFMRLAPNSITKVRVYIWIEGQDIDNYDFAQLGKTISINFGFTKERFTETDTSYDGPDLVTSDNATL